MNDMEILLKVICYILIFVDIIFSAWVYHDQNKEQEE